MGLIYPLTVATCLLWTLWRLARTIDDARHGRATRWTPLRGICDVLFAPRPHVDVYRAGMFASAPVAARRLQSTYGAATSTQRHPLLEAAYRRSEEQRQRLIAEVAGSLPPSEPHEVWYNRFVNANLDRAVDIEAHGIDVRDWPQLDGEFSL